MADEIDFSEFLPQTPTPIAPLPEVAPVPVAEPEALDFSEFMPGQPGAQSPGFNMSKFLGAAPSEPAGPVQTQVTVDAPLVEPTKEALPWMSGVVGRNVRAGLMGTEKILTSPFAALDLGIRNAVGSTGPVPDWSPYGHYAKADRLMRQEAEAASTYDESLLQQGVGMGVRSVADPANMLLGAGAAAGAVAKAGPMMGEQVARMLALKAAGTTGGITTGAQSLIGDAESKGSINSKDLGNAVVQGLIEKHLGQLSGATGSQRRIAGESKAANKVKELLQDLAVNEPVPEALTSVLQDSSDKAFQEGRLLTLGEGARSAAVGGIAGSVGSATVNPVMAANEAMTAAPEARPQELQPYAEHARLNALWNNLGVQDPAARMDPRSLADTEVAPVTTDTTPGANPNGNLNEPELGRSQVDTAAQAPITGADTVTAESVQDARSQQATAPNLAPVSGRPDIKLDGQDAGVQGREQRGVAKTQEFTPDQRASQKSEVRAANNDKVNQEYLDSQSAKQDEAPIRQASPKTAETQLDMAPVAQPKPGQTKLDFNAQQAQGPVQPSSTTAQDTIDFDAKPPSALDEANQYIDTVVAPEARVQARKALVGWDPKLDPTGYKGNIAMLVMAKHPAEGKRLAALIKAAPAPVAKAPVTPEVTPEQRSRGEVKKVKLIQEYLGTPGPAKAAPATMKPGKVRAFKDAGQHNMEVSKPINGVAIAYDKNRNVAVVVTRTDAKGRKNENGTEWRALSADGNVSYVGEPGVTVHKESGTKSAIESAVSEMSQTTKVGVAPADTTDEASPSKVSRGVEMPVDQEADAPAPRRRSVEALGREARLSALQAELDDLGKRADQLTDAELDRTDALEQEIKDTKAAMAQSAQAVPAAKDVSKASKASENSPLTPKMRKDFGENYTQEDLAGIPPRQVGQKVKQILTDDMGRVPTNSEVAAALRDLEGHDLLTPGQAVVPGHSIEAHALNLGPMLGVVRRALGADIHDRLESLVRDIPEAQTVQVDLKHESRPGNFGHAYNTAIHAVTRALTWTGPLGNWIERTLARQILGVPADLVAQDHPAFRPVLAAVREQMDVGRQRIAEAADRLAPLTTLEGQEYEHVKGALISFRLEGKNGRAKADFGNPVHYTDERERPHVYTLTPKELDVVERTFAANKELLKNHVAGFLEALGLPSNLTHAALMAGIANGTYAPSTKMLDGMLHTLETGSDSYVPLRRRGPNVVLVYDQTKYRAAKNAVERKAALLSTSNTTTLDQTRKAVNNAIHAYPTALITVHDRGPTAQVTPEQEVSERDLLDLATAAGVSPGVLQMFLSSGVADYFATRGTKARFVGANKMAGFDHDMKSVNVDHAVQMTHGLMSVKYGQKIEETLRLKNLGGDSSLQKFAQHYVNSQTAPTPWGISNIKQVAIAHYLGGAAVSALFNTATSFLTAPSYALQMSFSPVQSLKFFGEAAKQHARGILALVGRGHLYGKSRVQISADAWKATNPAMAKAILDAGHAGLYEGKYDSSIDDLAKYGEVRGITKVSQVAMNGLMHMFSVAETGNRLSSFVAAYQMFESAQSSGKTSKDQFYGVAAKNNLSVESAAAFARDFTNFIHHRNDKTEGSTITRGSADKNGTFQNSTWRQALFILRNYAVNTAVQQLRIAKAAVAQGLISSAVYAGIALSHIMLFGALNVIPGASTLAAIKDHFSDAPQTTKDQMQHHGAMGSIGSTGLLGHVAGKVSPLAGKYLDIVSQRVNNGGAIPTSLGSNTFVPIALIQEAAHSYDDVMSGDSARQLRGVASVLKSTKNLAEYGVAAANDTGKTSATGATVVAGKGKGAVLTTGSGNKIKMPELTTLDLMAGAVGITPPVVSDAYEALSEETKRKAANDKMFSLLTHRGAAASYLKIGSPERVQAFQDIGRDLSAWNAEAKKAGRPTDIILPVTLGQGIRVEKEAQGSGAFNLKRVQKLGRPEAVKALDEVAPENRPTE